MKIHLDRKTIAKSLLGFIGAQALVVVGGLCQRYLLPQDELLAKEEPETISECRDVVLYGTITLLRSPTELVEEKDRILHIALVGMTTGTAVTAATGPSGDIPNASLDFLT